MSSASTAVIVHPTKAYKHPRSSCAATKPVAVVDCIIWDDGQVTRSRPIFPQEVWTYDPLVHMDPTKKAEFLAQYRANLEKVKRHVLKSWYG